MADRDDSGGITPADVDMYDEADDRDGTSPDEAVGLSGCGASGGAVVGCDGMLESDGDEVDVMAAGDDDEGDDDDDVGDGLAGGGL